jgi:hypothetical protein
MIEIQHNVPTAIVAKREIAKGFKERRDFLLRQFLRMVIGYTPVAKT